MIDKSNCIKVGLIAKPHGVEGELVVRADYGFDADDLTYEFLLVEIDGGLVPYYVEEVRIKNSDEVLAKLEFCDTQEDAKRLAGQPVYISRDWLEGDQDCETSTGMLIGYEANDVELGHLGKIDSIDEQGGNNPLFVVVRDGEEILIPITDDFIESIDDDNMTVTFRLPEGLVEL